MRRNRIIVRPVAALGPVIANYPVRFLLGAGGRAFLARPRPFLLSAAAVLSASGFYRLWCPRRGSFQPDAISAVLIWFSATARLPFLLFPKTIANILVDAFRVAI